ncbi:MAG: InlB B-repeat-containing protein [Oscillospiraceae bacterium]|nr:InlB B-repeat-containing protein [Oscillospiraceae bacterium]
MKKSTVRIFAIVLVVLMCLSLLPLAAAHAMEYPAEMPEIPGFTWMGDHYVETEHIYGEVANEDFLVDESEPGDCETPALYWRSCINRNPITEERCGVTAETAYQEALQRAANDLNMQRNSGVQHTDSEWQDIWNRTAEEILNRYTFYYGGFGHQWVEVEYQPATCEQDGWETYHYCSACGEGLDYIPLIPATGHRYEDGICAVCGKRDVSAPVAMSDAAMFALSDNTTFDSDEPVELVEEVLKKSDSEDEIVYTEGGDGELDNKKNEGNNEFEEEDEGKPADNETYNAAGDVTITFDGNGGTDSTGTMADGQVIAVGDGADLIPNTFKLANNAFLGWSTTREGSTTSDYFTDKQHVTVDDFQTTVVTLYAQWDPIMVSFDSNWGSDGGSFGTAFSSTAYLVTEDGIHLPEANNGDSTHVVSRKGPYQFVGWNTAPDGKSGKHFENGAFVTTADIPVRTTLYAEWQKVITVYYNGNNGGANYDGGVYRPGATITVKAIEEVGNPTKPGRTFSGEWNTAADGSDEPAYKPGDKITLEENPSVWTFYAQWDFEITLDQNDGSGHTKTIEKVRENKDFTVPALPEDFTYDETTAVFKGWNTEKTGTGTSYAVGDTIPGTKMTGPFTLYARWADKYTVTFNGNGVTEGVPDSITQEEKTEVTLPSMTREGWSFVGWATSADGDMKYTDKIPAKDFTGDIELYAKWAEKPKAILERNDGSGTTEEVTVNEDGSITLPSPERAGYELLGWATSAAGKPVYTDTVPKTDVVDGMKLFAIWDKIYTVTFNSNTTAAETATQDIKESEFDGEKNKLTPNTFSNSGKVFDGWTKTPGGTTLDFADGAPVATTDFDSNAALSLYAVWKDFATITFDGNGSTSGEMSEMKVTDTAKPLPENTYKRTGYRFTGWNTEKDGSGSPFADQASVDTSIITTNVTLYAQWVKEFTVKYLANGGSGAIIKPETYITGEEVTIAANTFTKTGADFDSWNTKADGSGTTYKPGDKHTFSATDSDLTLYAQWTYTVTFDPNGEGSTGEIKPGNKDKAFEKQAYDIPENMSEGEDPKPLITRTGYVFTGWNTKADGTGDKYTDGGTIPASKVTGPITLYAQWDQEYTVNFNNTADSSQKMESQIILKSDLDKAEKTGGVALNPNTFTYDGYVFTGWSKNAAGTDGHFDDEGKVKATDFDSYAKLTLYAQWEHEIVITFKPGYDSALTHTQSVAKDKEVKELDANPFTRPQYLFKNWKTDDGRLYEDKDSIPAEYVKEDFNLTAQWNGPLTIKDTVTGSETTAYVGEPIQATIPETDGVTYQWYARQTPTGPKMALTNETSETLNRSAIPESTTHVKMPYVYCVAMKGSEEEGTYQETQSNYILLKDSLDTVSWGMDFINDGNLDKYPNAQYHTIPGYIEGVEEGMYYSTDNGVTWTKIPSNRISDGNFLVPGLGTYLIKPSEKSTVTSAPITIYNWYVVGYTVSTSTSASGTVRMTASNSSSSSGAMPSTPVLAESTQTQRDNNTIMKLASNWDNLWAVRSDNSRSITLSVQPSGSNSYGHIALNGTQIGTVSSTRSSSSSSSSSSSTWTTSVSPVSQPKIYSIVFNNSATSPRTADESHLGLWSALCLISLTGAATILGKTFKRKKTR